MRGLWGDKIGEGSREGIEIGIGRINIFVFPCFRKYLEKAGVLDLLTKSLVQLYEVSSVDTPISILKTFFERLKCQLDF